MSRPRSLRSSNSMVTYAEKTVSASGKIGAHQMTWRHMAKNGASAREWCSRFCQHGVIWRKKRWASALKWRSPFRWRHIKRERETPRRPMAEKWAAALSSRSPPWAEWARSQQLSYLNGTDIKLWMGAINNRESDRLQVLKREWLLLPFKCKAIAMEGMLHQTRIIFWPISIFPSFQ